MTPMMTTPAIEPDPSPIWMRACGLGRVFILCGAGILGFLGALHASMTLASSPGAGPMTPTDPMIQRSLERVGGLGFAPEAQVVMWDAWQGFNLSHALGLVVFAVVAIWGVLDRNMLASSRGLQLLLVLIPPVYLGISMRYWFSEPTSGIGAGTLLIEGGLAMFLLGNAITKRHASVRS